MKMCVYIFAAYIGDTGVVIFVVTFNWCVVYFCFSEAVKPAASSTAIPAPPPTPKPAAPTGIL